ncbi:hypothetical protein ACXYS1_26230, partial [Escherichia coli]
MTDDAGVWGAAAKLAGLPARYFFAVGGVAGVLLYLVLSEWAARLGLAGFPSWTPLALLAITLLSTAVG